MSSATHIDSLVDLGFTRLEAEAYSWLVEHSPATGYKVAKGINKPTANTYKAIESLQEKGAVVADNSDSKLCRATPPDELLDRLAQRFADLRRKAADGLSRLSASDGDDRIYQLESADQVRQKLGKMIESARHLVVLDLFPEAVYWVEEQAHKAAKRGVRVAMKVYEPTVIEGVDTVYDQRGKDLKKIWPGVVANAAIDGREFLQAHLSEDGNDVIQAIWSASPFLAQSHLQTLAGEIKRVGLEVSIQQTAPGGALEDQVGQYAYLTNLSALGTAGAASTYADKKA